MLYQEIKYLNEIGFIVWDKKLSFIRYYFEELDILKHIEGIFYMCAGERIQILRYSDNLSYGNSKTYFKSECLFIPEPLSKNSTIRKNSSKTELLEQLWFELGSLENPTQRQIDWYIASINNLT